MLPMLINTRVSSYLLISIIEDIVCKLLLFLWFSVVVPVGHGKLSLFFHSTSITFLHLSSKMPHIRYAKIAI